MRQSDSHNSLYEQFDKQEVEARSNKSQASKKFFVGMLISTVLLAVGLATPESFDVVLLPACLLFFGLALYSQMESTKYHTRALQLSDKKKTLEVYHKRD